MKRDNSKNEALLSDENILKRLKQVNKEIERERSDILKRKIKYNLERHLESASKRG